MVPAGRKLVHSAIEFSNLIAITFQEASMSEQVQAGEAAAQDTPEQAEFRAHCRDWLKNNHPGQPPVDFRAI